MQAQTAADRLNRGCFCRTLDDEALAEILDQQVGSPGFAMLLRSSRPTLFSCVPVFLPTETFEEMGRAVRAIEAASRAPGYRDAVLSWAPSTAQIDFGPVGAFMGYDFHLSADGPHLIEVNTNAGGAFLNEALARAQRACCTSFRLPVKPENPSAFSEKVAKMIAAEWRLQRGEGLPTTVAIIDDEPEQQYLYPEFQLARSLLEAKGLKAFVADPRQLERHAGRLAIRGEPIDLVYNRLVDFPLQEERHSVLRDAYLSGAVVVTPNPHVHAMLGDKRNLTLLSDPQRLEAWGVDPGDIATLGATVPTSMRVTPSNADDLWRDRGSLFFKPAGGYGSKAVYRGEKLTRRVWSEIVEGDYIAQTYVPPGRRIMKRAGGVTELKVDFRLYTYGGDVLLTAARLYQGQATNMRTPGGGFAPVLELAASDSGPSC